jgi:hypothetical protein
MSKCNITKHLYFFIRFNGVKILLCLSFLVVSGLTSTDDKHVFCRQVRLMARQRGRGFGSGREAKKITSNWRLRTRRMGLRRKFQCSCYFHPDSGASQLWRSSFLPHRIQYAMPYHAHYMLKMLLAT